MMKTLLAQGYEVEQRLAQQSKRGRIDADALLARLPWPKRFALQRVIALYAACSRLREDTRMSMITSIWLVRRVLCEIARRLVAERVLRDEAELAFLDFQDLRAYAHGHASAQALFTREKIDASRRLYQSWLADDEPPLTFIGHAQPRAPAVPGPGRGIDGLGTSRGRVHARARVIHDLAAQAGELRKGEIIVARFTDASWTPLIALAGGIVTDIGSMLSHSSIVAREFGIPSVVNTKTATARIRTGDELLVDGEAGLVRITSI